MYDIKNAFSFEFMRMLVVAAGLPPEAASDGSTTIENLQIHAYIHPSVPALGAAKLDISGVVNGISVKAGFDYKRP